MISSVHGTYCYNKIQENINIGVYPKSINSPITSKISSEAVFCIQSIPEVMFHSFHPLKTKFGEIFVFGLQNGSGNPHPDQPVQCGTGQADPVQELSRVITVAVAVCRA